MSGLIILEIMPILVTVLLFFVMRKMKYTNITRKFLVMILAVLLFMIMSEPMYRNMGLDSWAYLYRDVAWTVILGWADLFLISILVVDRLWSRVSEGRKFWLYLILMTFITVPIEAILLRSGLRDYSPVLSNTFSGLMIPLTAVPIEVLLAVPMIGALIISFYKYIGDY